MPFSDQVRLEALIACHRHCCLCLERKHTRIACHHIIQEADGGPNTFENCIPLCPDCHAEVKAFDVRHHPGMTSYSTKELLKRRDDWYAVVQRREQDAASFVRRVSSSIPRSKALQGEIAFDYSNHDGKFLLGEGNSEFLTRWSRGSNRSIHAYSDNTNVSLALCAPTIGLSHIQDSSILDFSSRTRSPSIGEILILENHKARYAAVKILELKSRSHGDQLDWARMAYWILDDGSTDFTKRG